MSNKDFEKELEQVSGGAGGVNSKVEMFEAIAHPKAQSKGDTPGVMDIGPRSIDYDDAHATIENYRDPLGRPVAGR